MAAVFDRELGALSAQDTAAKMAQLVDYIIYMQQQIEDTNSLTNRKIAALEVRIKQLEG
jgi:hypothetical protein